MANILIPGMSLPANCGKCRFCVDAWCYAVLPDEQTDCISIDQRPVWCPLREIRGQMTWEQFGKIQYKLGYLVGLAMREGVEFAGEFGSTASEILALLDEIANGGENEQES